MRRSVAVLLCTAALVAACGDDDDDGDATATTAGDAPVFRVDRFIVPPQALSAFMQRVQRVDRILAGLPGCRQNLVLTREGEDGHFSVVTLVEWAGVRTMNAAKLQMLQKYAEEGFDPAAFMAKLGGRAPVSWLQPQSGATAGPAAT